MPFKFAIPVLVQDNVRISDTIPVAVLAAAAFTHAASWGSVKLSEDTKVSLKQTSQRTIPIVEPPICTFNKFRVGFEARDKKSRHR